MERGDRWLDAQVRNLVDSSMFGMTDLEFERSKLGKERRENVEDRRRRKMMGLPPPLRESRAEPPVYREPRLRGCFFPLPQWEDHRRDLFRFLADQPARRRAPPVAAYWKKLARALDAQANAFRQELECSALESWRRGCEGEQLISRTGFEDRVFQGEVRRDLPVWRVRWLETVLGDALTEEEQMGQLELKNRRRAGLEIEMDQFELVHSSAAWRLVNEHVRVKHEPERTNRGARWVLMLSLTSLGLGVDVASKVTADLLLWFGVKGRKKKTQQWQAIKQWWRTLDPKGAR
jgi:hypothetical protein